MNSEKAEADGSEKCANDNSHAKNVLTFLVIYNCKKSKKKYHCKHSTMCGIWCCITSSQDNQTPACLKSTYSKWNQENLFENQNALNCRRGPDASKSRSFHLLNKTTPPTYIHLNSHVLWTQGETVQTQPYENHDSSKVMLFNGDIYSFTAADIETGDDMDRSTTQEMATERTKNDGLELFELLSSCESENEICNLMTNLQGPFAFILVDIVQGRLWFARDYFGRESLLLSYDRGGLDKGQLSWHISSVTVFEQSFEIPTSGLFCLDLKTKEMVLYPYNHVRDSISTLQHDFFATMKSAGFIYAATVSETKINLHFTPKLKFPKLSGEGTDVDDSLLTSLINEAYLSSTSEDFIKRSLFHLSYLVDSLIERLTESVKRRVYTIPPYCKNCMLKYKHENNASGNETCTHSKVGVLFSGGLDSTVIAYLAAEALPEGSSLDLLNVAFSKDGNFSNVPDRQTALESYKMLRERFKPQNKIVRLILVNVGKEEVEEERQRRIKYLVSPLKSVLDDSVGVCLWFAARGIGELYNDDETKREKYSSPIRVVLLGSGADELLGGYGRHRSAYEKSGWRGLGSEMQLDFDRISVRNMGRDNRIVSDFGICPRIPFLDERVVDFLTAQCDLWVKCCPVNVGPLQNRGSGEKLLLRAVAAKLFGDHYLSLALFPKRAMQFGSRIAKLENCKEKGGDSCQRLL